MHSLQLVGQTCSLVSQVDAKSMAGLEDACLDDAFATARPTRPGSAEAMTRLLIWTLPEGRTRKLIEFQLLPWWLLEAAQYNRVLLKAPQLEPFITASHLLALCDAGVHK